MKIEHLLGILTATILGTSLSLAQPTPPGPIEQLEQTQRGMQLQNPRMLNLSTNETAPEIYPGENQDVGPQRILRTAPPRKTWFEVVADSQYFYSDNVFLSDQHKVSAPIFVNTIQAAFAPEAYALGNGRFAPSVGFRSQWFNYGLGGGPSGVDLLDFNAQTAFISGRYQFGLWQVYGGFDFTRLLTQHDYTEIYREYVPSLGIQRVFPVCDKLAFSAGLAASYHWTETPAIIPFQRSDVNDRFDVSLQLAASWQPIQRLVVQPFYRFQYSQYSQFTDDTKPVKSRTDMVNSIGLTATYYFTKNISARVFANYEIRETDYSKAFEYNKLDTGGGLTLDFRF